MNWRRGGINATSVQNRGVISVISQTVSFMGRLLKVSNSNFEVKVSDFKSCYKLCHCYDSFQAQF